MYNNPYRSKNKWIICVKIWRIIVNEIHISNISLPIINGCDCITASAPFHHADRVTDFNILIYVTEGAIYVTEEDTDYVVEPGELLFLKSGVHHFGKYEIKRGTCWYYAHFYLPNTTDLPLFVSSNNALPMYDSIRYQTILPKKLTHLTGTKLERSIQEFTKYFHSSDTMKGWNINYRLGQLLSDIALYDKYQENPLSLSEKICMYLSEHYNSSFSAKELESHFYLSYKYLAHIFKKEKDMTMQTYHNEIRMRNAQNLLKSTLMPIGEISRMLGFTDKLYFSRCFSHYTGMSPTQYRRNASKTY